MDYALVYVTLRNYRKHAKLDMQFDGKSYILVGDTGEGKSSVLEALKVAHKFVPFPKDALKDGAKEGALEVGLMIKGEPYKVICDFDESGRGRWRVRSEGRGSFSLEEVLKQLFVGLATKGLNGAYFDYSQYFYECKSPAARFEYLMDCILGEVYDQNKKLVASLEKERGMVGTKRSLVQARVLNSEITEENFKELATLYNKPRTNDEAIAKRDQDKAARLTDISASQEELLRVKRDNLSFKNREQRIKDRRIREEEIQAQIKLLEEQLRAVAEERQELEDTNKKYPQDIQREVELTEFIDKTIEDNKAIEQEIQDEYERTRTANEAFNIKQAAFRSDSQNYQEAQLLDKQWKELDADIKNVRLNNIAALKKQLDIEGLEIKEIEKREKGEIKIEQHVFFEGRELNIENISKGESIKVATKIQEALNPAGFRLILLPEAQSLGSALPEIVEEAHKQGYQIIAEFTEPHRELEAVIVEDFIDEKEAEAQLLDQARKARKSKSAKESTRDGDKK